MSTRYLPLVALVILLAIGVVSCGSSESESLTAAQDYLTTPIPNVTRVPRAVMTPVPRSTLAPLASPRAPMVGTPLTTSVPSATITATSAATVTAEPLPSPTGTAVTTATPSPTVTPTLSATLTPTPGTPTTTPTPGPSRQVLSSAATLAQKTQAFREAVEANDTNAMLRLQRELLDEAGKVEASIADENSQYAEHLRSAIRAIREGSSGELGKLDAAARDLREAIGKQEGEESSRDQGTRTPSVSSSELRSMAESLSRKVGSFEDSLRSPNSEGTLRQQKELLDEMNRIEQAVKNDRTKLGEGLRSALESIRNGLAGDENKLDEAQRTLRKALED